MTITQQVIAEHLDLNQSNVSRFLKNVDFDWQSAGLDRIRIAYIQNLRLQAAAHSTADGLDLVHERVLTERVDRELKQFTLAEKKGLLINVAQLEPALTQMVGAFKAELLSRDDKLKASLDALYGIEIDVQLLNDYTHAAFNHLARYDTGDTSAVSETGRAGGTGGTDRSNEVVADASPVIG